MAGLWSLDNIRNQFFIVLFHFFYYFSRLVGNNDDNSHDGNDGLATTPSMDLGQLSQDVTAIEADLDKAIKMLAGLTAQHATGDGA